MCGECVGGSHEHDPTLWRPVVLVHVLESASSVGGTGASLLDEDDMRGGGEEYNWVSRQNETRPPKTSILDCLPKMIRWQRRWCRWHWQVFSDWKRSSFWTLPAQRSALWVLLP